jgi:hypothetical protein
MNIVDDAMKTPRSTPPLLTRAESEVMSVLWRRG